MKLKKLKIVSEIEKFQLSVLTEFGDRILNKIRKSNIWGKEQAMCLKQNLNKTLRRLHQKRRTKEVKKL